jgi:hypothetical protein
VKSAVLVDDGLMAVTTKLTVTTTGPCVYEVAKYDVEFPIPGVVLGSGQAAGKLNKKKSNVTCAPSISPPVESDLVDVHGGEPFETELRG